MIESPVLWEAKEISVVYIRVLEQKNVKVVLESILGNELCGCFCMVEVNLQECNFG